MLHAIRTLSHQRPLKVAKGFTLPPRLGSLGWKPRARACLTQESKNGFADRAPPPLPGKCLSQQEPTSGSHGTPSPLPYEEKLAILPKISRKAAFEATSPRDVSFREGKISGKFPSEKERILERFLFRRKSDNFAAGKRPPPHRAKSGRRQFIGPAFSLHLPRK